MVIKSFLIPSPPQVIALQPVPLTTNMDIFDDIKHTLLFKIGAPLALALSLLSGLALYRLFFHPLRHIPGPLLARLTYFYQFHYDVVLGGTMSKELPKLHEKYGLL
jgi:hypothetical protein